MRPSRWWIPAIAVAVLALAPTAHAQTGARGSLAVNPYVGVFRFDDSELEKDLGIEADIGPMAGVRLDVPLSERWWIEAAYGWASTTLEESEFVQFPEARVANDLSVHLAYGAVDYLMKSDVAPTRLVLSAGAGVAIVVPEIGDTDADFLATFGAGFTHPVASWIDFRGDFRDHVAFCAGSDDPDAFAGCVSDEALHHLEFTGGLVFWVR